MDTPTTPRQLGALALHKFGGSPFANSFSVARTPTRRRRPGPNHRSRQRRSVVLNTFTSLLSVGLFASSTAVCAGVFPMYGAWPQSRTPGEPFTLNYSYVDLLDGRLVDSLSGAPFSPVTLRGAFEAALADYTAFLPIHFVEVRDSGPPPESGEYDPVGLADIRVGLFDAPSGPNAYAYFPGNPDSGLAGDINFNVRGFAGRWTEFLFYVVAQHELGHSLGMGHEVETLPDHALPPRAANYDGSRIPITDGMITALQGVYGSGTGQVTPLHPIPIPVSWVLMLTGIGVIARYRRAAPGSGGDAAPRGRVARASRGLATLCAGLTIAGSANALTVEFDYRFDRSGFLSAPERRAVLETAALPFRGIVDDLAAISPASGASNTWRVSLIDPGFISSEVTLTDEAIAADTMKVFVGGSPSFPGVLGVADSGFDFKVAGDPEFVETVRSRGQGPTTGPAASDIGPFGGAIWFNSAVNWHFGLPGTPPPPGKNDFLTTAIHELFHLLGFGDSDAFRAQVSDDGRFFLGAESQRLFGGPVPLDRFASHFAEGMLGRTANGIQETLMDPSTPAGIRQLPTDLDYAVLNDIGWGITPVPIPVPPSLWLLGTTTLALMRFGKARRQAAA